MTATKTRSRRSSGPREPKHPHVAKAEQYITDVLSGAQPACKWVRLACRRQQRDLERSRTDPTWPYVFDRAVAERVCRFVELLPHIKGRWADAGEALRLEPWQCFAFVVTWGWVHRKGVKVDGRDVAGKRRFRRAGWFIPRKNSKSTMAAAGGLYMLAADGEYGAEVYSGATSEKQAWEVFGPARLMALRSPDFRSQFGVGVTASNLHILENGSRFEPIIGNPGDGPSPSMAIHDEYHEHASDAQVDSMKTGMGAREQPLQLIVTTAGENVEGPCYNFQLGLQQVLEGVVEDDRLFGIIYTIDQRPPGHTAESHPDELDDDWTSEDALRKANPNYGVSVSSAFLKDQLAEALRDPRKQGTYKTKHLNVWVQARAAYFNVQRWIDSGVLYDGHPVRMDQFAGDPCMAGMDLAAKLDLASVQFIFMLARCRSPVAKFLADLGFQYACFGWNYCPEKRVHDLDNTKRELYQAWVAGGHLIATDGGLIDLPRIERDVLAASKTYQLEKVGYDPTHATQMAINLDAAGVPIEEIRQTVVMLSDPMKWVDARSREMHLANDSNPCMRWQVSNVVAKVDAKDNVYPRKEREENKIDGPVALIMAMAVTLQGPQLSAYESRGLRTL